jgi:hypothetical protein
MPNPVAFGSRPAGFRLLATLENMGKSPPINSIKKSLNKFPAGWSHLQVIGIGLKSLTFLVVFLVRLFFYVRICFDGWRGANSPGRPALPCRLCLRCAWSDAPCLKWGMDNSLLARRFFGLKIFAAHYELQNFSTRGLAVAIAHPSH